MAIPEGYKTNFDTLLSAASAGDLCLMECTDKATGKRVIAVCATHLDEKKMIVFSPMAKMFDGNPYEELDPPGETHGADKSDAEIL